MMCYGFCFGQQMLLPLTPFWQGLRAWRCVSKGCLARRPFNSITSYTQIIIFSCSILDIDGCSTLQFVLGYHIIMSIPLKHALQYTLYHVQRGLHVDLFNLHVALLCRDNQAMRVTLWCCPHITLCLPTKTKGSGSHNYCSHRNHSKHRAHIDGCCLGNGGVQRYDSENIDDPQIMPAFWWCGDVCQVIMRTPVRLKRTSLSHQASVKAQRFPALVTLVFQPTPHGWSLNMVVVRMVLSNLEVLLAPFVIKSLL